MANTLLITKESGGYFTFVLNGNTSKKVESIGNDLLIDSTQCHFKTRNGANIIKEQIIYPSNVTLVAGGTFTFTTTAQLWAKLIEVGYFTSVENTEKLDKGAYIGNAGDLDERITELETTGVGGTAETAESIKTKYESNANTNAFTDAEQTKLANASKYDWFTINATKREDYILQREYNTNRAYSALSSREVNLSQAGDTYGHGAIINLHFASTKLYVVSIANTVDTGDSATSVNCFVRLQVLQGTTAGAINMPILSTRTIAKNGDVVGGKTITSGAGCPNAYMIGDVLHIIWSAQCNDGIWYEMHNTVNCLTDVIGTPEICTMESGLMTCQKIAAHLGRGDNLQICMNGTITLFGGYYYSAAVSSHFWTNGAILRTTDFVNWEFVKEPAFTGITPKAQWEISLGALGSFMYMAIRQIDLDPNLDINPIILAKLDASLNVVDWIEVPSGTSRPEFYLKGTTELYLVFPTDNRQNSILLLIDPILKNSRPVQDIPVWGNYVSIAQRGGGASLQFAVRTAGSTGLRVSSMNANNISSTAIMTTREYISTLTSDAQTQINSKAPIANPTFTGVVTTPVLKISTIPTLSASSYEILTRNNSTGLAEKITPSSIQFGDNVAAASALNVGAIRYRVSGNNSYAEMCMQVSASGYQWVTIVENNW